ncbi:MAG: ArsR family transcriptional regulator [Betaproteobacteria bacterium SG8_41]|jgi:ArsR family transcriptional regulator|nr:MAG: ArsR family transcriptional regulator [Betaproteobacteria bacterium SG8_41]
METKAAAGALGALSQETRLAIFRLLVRAGPDGLPAGKVATELDVPPATLSFHLTQLARASLVRSRRRGRFVIYIADFDAMTALLTYLTEDCCSGTIRCDIPACAAGTLIGQHRRAKGAPA